MKFCRDVLLIGAAGTVIGMHFFLLMSPKTQKEIERGMRRTVREMRELTDQMVKAAKQLG